MKQRPHTLLTILIAAAVAAALATTAGWISEKALRWIVLLLLGFYWIRFIVLPVDVIKRTKVLNRFAVTWWVNNFPVLPAITGAILLWRGAAHEERIWGSLLLFILVSALAGYLTILRYNHKLKKLKP